ncbi:hypothetical protein DI392_08190 [Vibrio albus]|uniref:DUF2726 domain-containing protein n=1 Tax=Vibrio albus TaxID=2200953 RepID=A0A2U3BBK1_9VIBR|nr:DUF2726 domain-containing protein [Vibrio albus]PWI34157.1 hypothetical protein DI392_08190 [Vibrio albus]
MLYLLITVIAGYVILKLILTNQPQKAKQPSNSSESAITVKHVKQEYLATQNEQKLHQALQAILNENYIIHSQVSLMALVTPKNFKDNSKTWAKRMDFVITDKMTRVLAVIELDDSTHNRKSRQKRDLYVNNALKDHHPLIRIQSRRYYEQSEIAKILEEQAGIKCVQELQATS